MINIVPTIRLTQIVALNSLSFMKFLVYILLLCPILSFGSDRIDAIRELKTEGPSLLNSYLELMEKEKLIHQTDIRLKKRKLLKKNGGLCSFTAQVNAIQAVSQYYGVSKSKFLKRPDYFLFEIIEEARRFMVEDPRYEGAYLSDVEKYTEEVLEEHGLDGIIRLEYTDKKADLDPTQFKNYSWRLRVLGMLSKNEDEGHTVVALKVDQKNSIMYISDPNYPNKVLKTPFKKSKKGLELYLNDDFPGFQPAIVDEMIEVNVLRDRDIE